MSLLTRYSEIDHPQNFNINMSYEDPAKGFNDRGGVWEGWGDCHQCHLRNNLEDLVLRIASAELVKLWPLS
jgi:hypothetical protein